MSEICIDEGVAKWGVLFGVVGVLELVGEETLTSAYNRALEHEKMRYVALGGLVLTAMHLTGILPREVDPYYRATAWIDRFKG